MTRRIATAREQVEMLMPWRVAAEAIPSPDLFLHPDELSQYLNPANEIHNHRLDRIRPSVSQGGVQFPIQINTDGVHARIDDGHHRVTVAQQEGLDKVPVMVLPVDKHYFSGKRPEFAPPIQSGLSQWMKQRTAVWRDHPWLDDSELAIHDMIDPKADFAKYLRGPEDAYDEYDSEFGSWADRVHNHPPIPTPLDVEWYHATYNDLPVGTILAPHKGKVPWLDNPYHGGLDNRANWTWVEYDITHSDEWLGYMVRDHGAGFLYKVKVNIGPFPWNGDAKEGWVTDYAVITEKVRDANAEGIEAKVARRVAIQQPHPDLQLHYFPDQKSVEAAYGPGEIQAPAVTAHHPDSKYQPTGFLQWDTADHHERPNTVSWVDVDPDFRRHGIGAAMWEHAKKFNPDIQHSEQRSIEGDDWAHAVGGDLPPLMDEDDDWGGE